MFKFFGKLVNRVDKILPYTEEAPVKNTFIKHMNSKGPGSPLIALTVNDVKKGYVVDFDGYKNEVVLFLRKNKQDR